MAPSDVLELHDELADAYDRLGRVQASARAFRRYSSAARSASQAPSARSSTRAYVSGGPAAASLSSRYTRSSSSTRTAPSSLTRLREQRAASTYTTGNAHQQLPTSMVDALSKMAQETFWKPCENDGTHAIKIGRSGPASRANVVSRGDALDVIGWR